MWLVLWRSKVGNSGYIHPCPLEEFDREDGWVVVKDGQCRPSSDGSRQFTSAPDEIRYFIRVLRKRENSRFVDRWKTYIYDYRNKRCIDIIASRTPPNSGSRNGAVRVRSRDEELEAGG
jgi:hypothetical protein